MLSLIEAVDQSSSSEVKLDKEKMLVVLSIYILSGKTEIIEPTSVVEKLVQIFNGIINGDDFKVEQLWPICACLTVSPLYIKSILFFKICIGHHFVSNTEAREVALVL